MKIGSRTEQFPGAHSGPTPDSVHARQTKGPAASTIVLDNRSVPKDGVHTWAPRTGNLPRLPLTGSDLPVPVTGALEALLAQVREPALIGNYSPDRVQSARKTAQQGIAKLLAGLN